MGIEGRLVGIQETPYIFVRVTIMCPRSLAHVQPQRSKSERLKGETYSDKRNRKKDIGGARNS